MRPKLSGRVAYLPRGAREDDEIREAKRHNVNIDAGEVANGAVFSDNYIRDIMVV